MPLLIVRPEPGASATLSRARALGLEAVAAPLFRVAPVTWAVPDPAAHDSLLLTSANAVRHAGPGLERLRGLPAYAVGEATAAAARAAGLTVAGIGTRNVEALLAQVADDGRRRPLHLAGEDRRPAGHADLRITIRTVYRAEAVDRLPDAAADCLAQGGTVLLHSPRAGAVLAALTEQAGIDRARTMLAAISDATASAAGGGWRSVVVAAVPTDDALLAAAARLCEEEAASTGERGRE